MPTTTRTTLPAGTVAGREITITLDVTEPDPVPFEPAWPRPVVGATVDSSVFDLLTTGRAAGARFCRTFSAPDEAILPWTHARRRVPTGVAEFHSFKAWESDTTAVARVTALLDTMPARLLEEPALLPELDVYDPDGYSENMPQSDGFSFLVTYCHEGEKNFVEQGLPPREWRRRHRLVYKTIRQHPNGHRVGYMPIQTGTWTEAPSIPAKGVVKGDHDPFTWWAGVGDYAGYDAYVPTVTGRAANASLYPDPARFLAVPLQLAAGTGRRLFLPEIGVALQGSPKDTGVHRAPWMRRVAAYAAEQGVAGMAWWDDLGSKDFRLTDAVSAAAWADVIAGRY